MQNSKVIIGTGLATFFFGFGAGAILNIYLNLIHSPLTSQLRSSLSYISSIVGDGLLLPIVNMIVVSFLLRNRQFINRGSWVGSGCLGFLITVYFHVTQAINGLTNWTMPTPWHWNFLGYWHAVYMFAVCSLLSMFLLMVIKVTRKNKSFPKEGILVLGGVIIFLILLRLDYSFVSLQSAIPH